MLKPPWSRGERLAAAAGEKKRANVDGAVEAPAAAMRKEERCVALFYFVFVLDEELCMRGGSRLWASPVGLVSHVRHRTDARAVSLSKFKTWLTVGT